ncbi:MAG: pyruvate dehydrogenase (acetyl-transferring) E1 component subunit alpha [Saprospiraceae bacterium]|nr:pyruvate dehydrogenase (acetyl-transferring) E1 component subunit alpha [Saprospiraceae bacterium]
MEVVATKKATTSGAKSAKIAPQYSPEMYKEWYTLMYRIRRFEERVLEFYGEYVRGFCHVYIGQEAIAAGMKSALDPMDGVVTAYRQHGIGIMKGISAREAMAELFGRATGIVKGKGGSMHFFNAREKYFGGNGIVGAQIGIGTGIAFAEKYKGTNLLCVTMFGDGAARQGILYEAGNMAMTWKLPVIYVCENNGYAMGTSVARTSNVRDIYQVAEAFNMPAEQVDGMNPEAVHEAFTRAAEHMRAGNGPYFLEIKTYRYKGHSVSDPEKYRKDEKGRAEVAYYKTIDPLKTTRAKMLEIGVSEEEIKAIEDAAEVEMQDAVDFAKASPFPDPADLYEDNYVQADYPFMKD